MQGAVGLTPTPNPSDAIHRASGWRENLTSRSYGEGLDTGRATTQAPRQSLPRHLIFTSWKSSLHWAALTTTKEDSPLGYLYGRMLRILLHDALCPQTRATLWLQSQRALSLLKFARHVQALAASWLQAILQSACALYHFLQRACTTAERLAAKAVRKRRPTAQTLCDSVKNQGQTVVFMEAVSA